ncbi:efflux transporter outer membrane subunit [Chitinasiproducens palmae]|uniref:Efflux transporter, outer membrane factor (OMF) lipoprotein, NodT family n=1 Tax=Chitinasiproducens palmae TaxID=1770053 RepID=A0A1H2PLG0_9BURK|nr:efflux transporter outer membrane subunit [Chitinasiproducens palmae]SDV47320.1 efflux transporter, outer membrane factor (OMF) lipoprotein, NodT family [Chitinasiproducens palmae]
MSIMKNRLAATSPLPSTFRPRRAAAAPLLAVAALTLAACTVGPDYRRPDAPVSLTFKEADGWKAATPGDDRPKGAWWAPFGDATLSELLAQVQVSNQNVANYAALYREALALARASQSDLLPSATASLQSTRSRSATSATRSSAYGTTDSISNAHTATASLSWELDIWGKLRRTLEENRASAAASAAELANATLSAQSELAQDYFQVRGLDRRIALYDQTIAAYERYATVIRNKYDEHIASRATLAQANNQLESARSSRLDLVWQRAQLEHAIALLIGKPPADFALAVDAAWVPRLPDIPVGLPTQLLERRPDIAEAERKMAAANAAVGVAVAAYFPDLTLSASAGFQSTVFSRLFSLPNRFWSVGPTLSGTLFDFGATRAGVEQARAAYDAQVATYRQTVLTALGQVEDYLVELRTLDPEIEAQRRAAAAAGESAEVTRDQYEAGMIDYLDVATTQASLLSAQQSLLTLQSTQLVTSVQLIAALGGGWDSQASAGQR